MSGRRGGLQGLEIRRKWRVGEALGEGACSVVHVAEPLWQGSRSVHVRLARPDAAYVIKLSKLDKTGGANKPKGKKGKISELQRLANLLSGEHLAYMNVLNQSDLFPSEGPFGYGEVEGYRYLVMERLGLPLDAAIKATPMDLEQVGALGLQIVDSLEYLHSKGYVYVDIKPENIMLGRWHVQDDEAVELEQARLVDFGLMVKYRTYQGQHRDAGGGGIPPGTPRFMGLALHRDGTANCRRDDVEALGYVLLWCASGGALPWDGDMDTEEALKQAKEGAGSGVDCCRTMGLSTQAATALGGYIDSCRAVEYEHAPDYEALREYLRTLQHSPRKGKARWSPDEVVVVDPPHSAKRRRRQRATSKPAKADVADESSSSRTSTRSLPILYVHDHCPECTSVRFYLGLRNIKHDLRFLMYDDVTTAKSLAGQLGKTPIWSHGDEIIHGSAKILEAIRQDDRFGQVDAISPASDRRDLRHWHAEYENLWRLLQMPRFAHKQSLLPELQQRDSRRKFQKDTFLPLEDQTPRSFARLDQDERQGCYDRALQMTEVLLEQADLALLELTDMLHNEAFATEGGLSLDDVHLWPKLRGISIVKGLQVPGKLHEYMTSLSELSDVPLFWNAAI